MRHVRRDEQRHLAGILADCVERLQEDAPTELIAKRLLDVEYALLQDIQRQRRRPLRTLARDWSSPRLGTLRQHPPVQLRVPTGYLRTRVPFDAPTISIVTPSYEQGRYLSRTLSSVLEQHYPRLEYVVQDGGSEDETPGVLERFGGALTSWTSEPDGGQADAINRGFARTSGEIMAYLNSDDLLLPGSLAYVAGYFAEHGDVDVVYGHRILIDELDRQIGRWVLPPHDEQVLSVADFVPQETLFWRRSIWERAGQRMDTSLSFAIDWDLLLRMRDAGARMVRLPRYLGAFRVHEQQKTSREQLLCRQETELLHRRVLGRTMSNEEASVRSRRYLRRHVVHHSAHRLLERLPFARINVRTRSLEEIGEMPAISPFDQR